MDCVKYWTLCVNLWVLSEKIASVRIKAPLRRNGTTARLHQGGDAVKQVELQGQGQLQLNLV
jgi:hypothetical protein